MTAADERAAIVRLLREQAADARRAATCYEHRVAANVLDRAADDVERGKHNEATLAGEAR